MKIEHNQKYVDGLYKQIDELKDLVAAVTKSKEEICNILVSLHAKQLKRTANLESAILHALGELPHTLGDGGIRRELEDAFTSQGKYFIDYTGSEE